MSEPLRIQGHRGVYQSAYTKILSGDPANAFFPFESRVPNFVNSDYTEPHSALTSNIIFSLATKNIHIADSAYPGYAGSETLRKLNILVTAE
jgi:hypothetical protein